MTCNTCANNGPCASQQAICQNDPECVDYYNCLMACGPDPNCVATCGLLYPVGETEYFDYADCVICVACYNDCDGPGAGC
jgi:hypothetical protein